MPYLANRRRRQALDSYLPFIADGAEFNFVIGRLVDRFIESHGLEYHTLEEIDGALDLAVNEFKDRIVRPYEDHKRRLNGEVFTHTAAVLDALVGPKH